jgi:hypothetical protein
MKEMNRLGVDILGMSEVHKDGFTFIYSGGDKHLYVVGLMLKSKVAKSLLGQWS